MSAVEKPKVLYHGSPNGQIDEFVPHSKESRDESPAVYATPDKYLAMMFMHKNMGLVGHFGDIPYGILFGSREECEHNDHDGHLYTLPSDTFELNHNRGLQGREWVSHNPVKPMQVQKYDSTIDTMLKEGVQVYIMDRQMYNEIKASSDHGQEILRNVQSENQHRGINIRPF